MRSFGQRRISLKDRFFKRVQKNLPPEPEVEALCALHTHGFVFLCPENQIVIRDGRVRELDLSATFVIDVWEQDKSAFDGFNEISERWSRDHPGADEPSFEEAFQSPREHFTEDEMVSYGEKLMECTFAVDRFYSMFSTDENYPPWLESQAKLVHWMRSPELFSKTFPICWEKSRRMREEQRQWMVNTIPELAKFDPDLVEDKGVKIRKDCSINCLSTMSEVFERFTHLETLDLSFHDFEEVPASVCQLPNLRRLDFSENRLKSLEGLENLKALTHLDVSGNEIEDFAPLERLPNLKEVNLSKNRAAMLPAFHRKGSLKLLNAERNPIERMPNAKKWAKSLRNVAAINLRRAEIRDLPEWFKELSSLEYLDLSHNFLGEEKGRTRADFRSWSALCYLNLAHNSLTAFPLLPKHACRVDLRFNFLDGVSPPQRLTELEWLGVTGNETAIYEEGKPLYSPDVQIETDKTPRKLPFASIESFCPVVRVFNRVEPDPIFTPTESK